ncbi:hypothetical protein BLNAU_4147 [Blattamonas nauphoetae]|uniref:DUF4371 domain-containing protein n=1 Tax=Blattamonas nauphoetae TaxID=2049346 RepID=A0ABQ9YAK2_9EUKA|nr:hypothetical protein BLNAU_4147 [Blattamonas nauphoetae]
MTGFGNGLWGRLLREYNGILPFHCAAHRLQLLTTPLYDLCKFLQSKELTFINYDAKLSETKDKINDGEKVLSTVLLARAAILELSILPSLTDQEVAHVHLEASHFQKLLLLYFEHFFERNEIEAAIRHLSPIRLRNDNFLNDARDAAALLSYILQQDQAEPILKEDVDIEPYIHFCRSFPDLSNETAFNCIQAFLKQNGSSLIVQIVGRSVRLSDDSKTQEGQPTAQDRVDQGQ